MAEPRENVYTRPLGVIQHLHCHYTVVTIWLLGCKKSAQLQGEPQSKRGITRMWEDQATYIPEEPGRSCNSKRVELAVLLSAYSSLQQTLLFQGEPSPFSVKGTGLWSDLTEIQLAYMQHFLHDSSPSAKAQRLACPFPEWETSLSWLHTDHICLAPHEQVEEQARRSAWSSAKGAHVDFCRIQQGLDHQPKCGGCKRIEALMQYWTTSQDSRRDGRRPAPHSRPELIHNSYNELDFCAQRCITCRVIRRGLLLNQPMINEVASLGIYPHKVWATMAGAEMEHMTLDVAFEPNSNSPGSTFTSTINFCAKGGDISGRGAARNKSRHKSRLWPSNSLGRCLPTRPHGVRKPQLVHQQSHASSPHHIALARPAGRCPTGCGARQVHRAELLLVDP